MLKELLVKLGIGSASVDLSLDRTDVEQGDTVTGSLDVEGGWVDQDVQQADYAVRSEYVVETDEGTSRREHTVSKGTLTEGFTIESEESHSVDVEIEVPPETPTTLGSESVWVDTALDVEMANDPDDTDHLSVDPGGLLAASFDALDSLGFQLSSAENQTSGSSLRQELEFHAGSGPFAGDLDELEVLPRHRDDRLELVLEVDSSGGLISEMTGSDESHTIVAVTEADPAAIEEDLRAAIEEHR